MDEGIEATPRNRGQELAFARRLARLVDELKGGDVVVLDMLESLEIVDYFVIATGLNERHLRAMASEIDVRVKKEDERLKNHAEGMKNERWVLLDYGAVVVHLFHPDAREYYDLEFLWAEAPRVDWKDGAEDDTPG